MNFDYDILPIVGVRGKVARERRRVCTGRFKPWAMAKGHRRARKAVKLALRTGGRMREPRAVSAYDS